MRAILFSEAMAIVIHFQQPERNFSEFFMKESVEPGSEPED